MKGNIVTVFIIQLGGFSVAALRPVLEMGFHKISALRKTMEVELLRACRRLDWLFSFVMLHLDWLLM